MLTPHNIARLLPHIPGLTAVVDRLHVFKTLLTYVETASIPGDYVETGVHVGDSATAVAEHLVCAKKTPQVRLLQASLCSSFFNLLGEGKLMSGAVSGRGARKSLFY